MSGHEVCRRLRAGGYSGAILIYSGDDTVPDLVLVHEAGADDHVSKAADLLVLQAKIRRAVERVRERWGPPSSRRRPGRPSGIRDLLRDLERGHPVDWGSLTQLEEHLLCMLVCARGKAVSAEALLLEGWDRADLPVAKLHEPIPSVREKRESCQWCIRDVRGREHSLKRGEERAARGRMAGSSQGNLGVPAARHRAVEAGRSPSTLSSERMRSCRMRSGSAASCQSRLRIEADRDGQWSFFIGTEALSEPTDAHGRAGYRHGLRGTSAAWLPGRTFARRTARGKQPSARKAAP
jgi:DNA-binding response OmpR family regulator